MQDRITYNKLQDVFAIYAEHFNLNTDPDKGAYYRLDRGSSRNKYVQIIKIHPEHGLGHTNPFGHNFYTYRELFIMLWFAMDSDNHRKVNQVRNENPIK